MFVKVQINLHWKISVGHSKDWNILRRHIVNKTACLNLKTVADILLNENIVA